MMQQAGGMDVNSLMQRLRRLATLDTTVFDADYHGQPRSFSVANRFLMVSKLPVE